jgi:hypothetical protein
VTRWLPLWICLLWAIGTSAAVSATPRYFVVLVDTAPPGAQSQEPLREAEERLTDLLFHEGWYVFGRDTITILASGPGGAGHVVAPITRTAIKIRESRFRQLLHPNLHSKAQDPLEALAAGFALWNRPQKGANAYLVSLRDDPVIVMTTDTSPQPNTQKDQIHLKTLGTYESGRGYLIEFSSLVLAPSSHPAALRHHTTSPSRVPQLLEAVTAALATGWLVAWVSRQRKAAHFGLWIPGFAREFALPPIIHSSPSNFRARLPRYAGEPAVHLQLPSRTIRLLFYSRAKLQWDPRVQVEGLPPGVSAYPISRLPRFVRFVWVERPSDAGNLAISVVRPGMLGGNDRLAINVSFLALPQTEPEVRV